MSFRRCRSFLVFLLTFCILFTVLGCTPAIRPTGFENSLQNFKTIAVFPPDVRIYELGVGSGRELIEDLSAKGRENFKEAIKVRLNNKPVELKIIEVNKNMEEEIQDIQALFRAVNYSINALNCKECKPLFLYEIDNIGLDKHWLFEAHSGIYSKSPIGSVSEILKAYNADAALLVFGVDEVSTTGRKVSKGVAATIGLPIDIIWSHLTVGGKIGGQKGATELLMPRASKTDVGIALIDASGSILWYNTVSTGSDLRDPEKMLELIKDITY